MRSIAKCIAMVAALLATAQGAAAQAYPSRPITMINPFPPGGATDILARTLTEHVKITLRQPIIVEDVPGAGGSIGAGRVARAAPDGYTLGFGNWASHVGSGAMYPLNYDLLKDLARVGLAAEQGAGAAEHHVPMRAVQAGDGRGVEDHGQPASGAPGSTPSLRTMVSSRVVG